jgi:hypothetical protein
MRDVQGRAIVPSAARPLGLSGHCFRKSFDAPVIESRLYHTPLPQVKVALAEK